MELINFIWRKDFLNDVYNILDENCKKFAATVFNRIESPCDEQVYFDEAADQPRSSANTCRMSVEKLICKVQRLSASETFSKVELYTAARLKSVITAAIATCLHGVLSLPFLISVTKEIIFHSEISFQTFFCFFFFSSCVYNGFVCLVVVHLKILWRAFISLFRHFSNEHANLLVVRAISEALRHPPSQQ